MKYPKKKVYRNKKILQAAKGEACVNCRGNDGTTVAAHYSGAGSYLLGKGTGIKGHDFAVAFLCYKCHKIFDEHKITSDFIKDAYRNDIYFLINILKTQARLFEKGVIK